MVRGDRLRRWALVGALTVCASLGCAQARYVVKEPNAGVVAIPSNTPKHREKAEELMLAHFPQGYVIDREEETAVGLRTNSVQVVGPYQTYALEPTREWHISYHAIVPVAHRHSGE